MATPAPAVDHQPLPIVRRVKRGTLTYVVRCSCGFTAGSLTKVSSCYIILREHFDRERRPV